MTSSETERLNFYSKYNRVRERQDIDSLYALIDADLDRNDSLTLTLNCSRAAEPNDEHPRPLAPRRQEPIMPSLHEQEEQERTREMEEKLRKLQRMERDFHEQMERSEREQRRKQEAKQTKRRERENYRHQLINVIEHTSEHSHQEPPPPPPPARPLDSPSPSPPPAEDYDDYYGSQEIPLREDSEFDVRETRRKLKEIIEIQRKREREVESVQENNDVKTSSIVIERLSIMPKSKDPVPPAPPKEVRNYCEVQLGRSQSANLLRSVRSVEKIEVEERIPQAEEQEDHYHYPDTHLHYEEVNLNYEDTQDGQYDQQDPEEHSQLEEAENEDDEGEEEEQDCNYEYEYEQSEGVDPPITLTQEDNHPLTAEDGSELNEEIADHVVSIGDLSEQQSQPPLHTGHRGPLFFSQAHPRNSFHSQHEVQSIAESIDFHPLEPQMGREAKSQLILEGQPDRKTSFKKLMAENRANLIPRLAISTILNEHINEALASHPTPPPPLPPAPAALHESIISSEGSMGKPGKVNFKSMLRRNKVGSSRVEMKTSRDPAKTQANKNLLLSFFDEN